MTTQKESLRSSFLKLLSNIYVWVPITKSQQCFLPIVDNRAELKRMVSWQTIRKQNVCGCLVSWYIILDTSYYLYTIGYDPADPIIYQHITVSFLPVFVRMQNDIVVICGLFVTTMLQPVYFPASIFNCFKHMTKVVLTPMEDGLLRTLEGQTISRELSRKLLLFWKRIRPKLRIITLFSETSMNVAYGGPHASLGLYRVFIQDRFEPRYWWMGLVCIFFHHYVLSKLMSVNMFVVVNLYLNVRQRHYLDEIKLGMYKSFETTLKTLQEHTAEVQMYNRFYSFHVTVIIYAFSVISGSLFLGAIHSTDVSPIIKIPWIILAVISVAVVPMYTITGSRTNLLNRKLFFKLRALQISICSLEKLNFRRQIVRLDLMNEYKVMLLKPCFRLITSSPLNNKYLVFELLGFLSVAYMKIISRAVL